MRTFDDDNIKEFKEMDKIKILVAQHKAANVFKNDVYTPIQVGKAISKVDLGILGDDTGDNISKLNPFYSELTAQYWGWKNLNNVEYIGLSHYRRYFETEFTAENIDEQIKGYDIILSKKVIFGTNLLTWLSQSLIPEDIALFYLYMTKRYADNMEVFNAFYQKGNKLNAANMFVCKKSLFNEFCEWQFGILEDMREILPLSPYSRERRILGYFSETLLPFYAFQKGLRVKEEPVVSMVGEKSKSSLISRLREIKTDILFNRKDRTYQVADASLVGLRQDGLLDKLEEVVDRRNKTSK